jgi:alginate O-acetyltransferase complex protein AlgI
MDKTANDSLKKRIMVINIIIILLPLFFFKYFNTINEGVYSILKSLHIRWALPEIKLFLPLGISFYTFMAIGYTVDVYNQEINSEENIGVLALFISFFPLIMSGPIERAKNMLPQFNKIRRLDYVMFVKGLRLMLWGYFMKLVVADRLGIYIDAIYNNISLHNGTSLLFASALYPFQIYADLGGYSLIAIGTANVLGFNIIQNFKRPFFAVTMSEIWRRWHISLISWLTDYIYTPLSFKYRKFGVWGIVLAIMITFLLSGIWHGATIAFIVWGILQGLFLSVEALTNKKRAKFEKNHMLKDNRWYISFNIFFTFVLFAASLIFARAPNLNNAINIYQKIFTFPGDLFIGSPSTLIYSFLGLALLIAKDFTDEFMPSRFLFFENKYKTVRLISYSSIILLILLIGVFDGGQFIYFQF